MDVSSLNLALPPAGTVPDWVHILPAGTFSGQDGRGPYVLKDAQAVIAASLQRGAIPFDENHSTVSASSVGGAAPARGWIDQMQVREDGIWGHVDWTPAGRAIMAGKEYRWVSPVFAHLKDGEVLEIASVALTNNPNLIEHLQAMQTVMTVRADGLSEAERVEAWRRIRARTTESGATIRGWSAHTSQEGNMDKKAICTALGLPEATEDTAVMTAIHTGAGAQTALQTANARVKELETELSTVKTTHVPLEKVTVMQTQIDTMLADGKKAKAEAFIDGAIKEGKPIAATREFYIAQHVAQPEQTEKAVNALPSINSAGTGVKRAKNDADEDGVEAMSAEDKAVCSKMGLDPKAYMKSKNAKGAK